MHAITTCPTCGSKRIKRVRKQITRTVKGRRYTVPSVLLYECPDCGERIFPPESVRKIRQHSPRQRRALAS